MLCRHIRSYVSGRRLIIGRLTLIVTLSLCGTICLVFGACQTHSQWYACEGNDAPDDSDWQSSTVSFNLRTFIYVALTKVNPPESSSESGPTTYEYVTEVYDVCDSKVKEIYGIEICEPMRRGFWCIMASAIVGSISTLIMITFYCTRHRYYHFALGGLLSLIFTTVGAVLSSVMATTTIGWLIYPGYGDPRNIWSWRSGSWCQADRTGLWLVLTGSIFYILCANASCICFYDWCNFGAPQPNRPSGSQLSDYTPISVRPISPEENAAAAVGDINIIEATPVRISTHIPPIRELELTPTNE